MRKLKKLSVTVVMLVVISCSNYQDCCLPAEERDGLIGTWRIFERGYSPGFNYIIEEVPSFPAQNLTFSAENQFSTNVSGLDKFGYYLVLNDGINGEVLALFENKTDLQNNQDINRLVHSYNVKFEEGNLKLYYRYCFEGCHMGLKKIL
jgi:hypothetical protein